MAALLDAQSLQSFIQSKCSVSEVFLSFAPFAFLSTRSQVLYAAAWVVGEFSEYLTAPLPVLQAMLQPRITALPGSSSRRQYRQHTPA